MKILGVDPGGRHTGIVWRDGDVLLDWRLSVRQDNGRLPDGRYVRQVLHDCLACVDRTEPDLYGVAVEGVAWWPKKKGGPPRNQTGLYGTAIIIGALLARWPNAVLVDSGRGAAGLHPQAYPEQIRPPVNGRGKDRLSHVRAAWDHSHAGETEINRRWREVR